MAIVKGILSIIPDAIAPTQSKRIFARRRFSLASPTIPDEKSSSKPENSNPPTQIKREAKNKKFSQYKVIKETFNEKAFDLDTKKYQKYIKEYNELCIKRKEDFLKDLAEENNVNIDFVVKALKCLDFVVDEFCNDGLTGHIYDYYHLKENEEIFGKCSSSGNIVCWL